MILGYKPLSKMFTPGRESGAAIIFFAFIIGLAMTSYVLYGISSQRLKANNDHATREALKQAKAALIAFSAQDLSPGICTTNCPRPGDLPCPDTDNDGLSNACSSQALRLGRLPWKTLGIEDLRDASSERLWYAVSTNYKNNPRIRPLNSDTPGTITLRSSTGAIVNDGGDSTGVVAIVFAPGSPLVREDGVAQMRDSSNQNIPINYLDVAFGEDNANFVDGNANGFITGPITGSNNQEILNDQIVSITKNDMVAMMESRVLAETTNALLDYYCGSGNANYSLKVCMNFAGNRFFPNAALFNDTTCLGYTANLGSCLPNVASNARGRVPANPSPDWNSTSILRSIVNGNWFQQNGWRELIYYAVAPACLASTPDCSGSGFLTLNNSLTTPVNSKRFVVIATGQALNAQSRVSNVNKSAEFNYLEGENITPLDNIYTRSSPLTLSINDRAASLP